MMEKENRCIGCGNINSEIFLEGPDRMQGTPGHFTLRCCRFCGTIFLSPQPNKTALLRYYPEDYAAYDPGKEPGAMASWSLAYGVQKQVRAVLKGHLQPGRALDVGCGGGEFLAALQGQGWQVQGTEINASIAGFARRRRGLDLTNADSACLPYASGCFDLITFWDVLEHLPDPCLALREAARLARPSARLVASLPNPESLEANIMGRYWAGWDLPRHLWLFPRQVLTDLMEDAGWQVDEVRCLRGRHWLLAKGLDYWLQDKHLPRWLYQLFLVVINSWLIRLLLLPYFALVERMGKGSIMVFFAHRKEDRHA